MASIRKRSAKIRDERDERARERPAQGRKRARQSKCDENRHLPRRFDHSTDRINETPSRRMLLAGQPKKRIPRAAQGERRSHLALLAANLVPCPQCKYPKPRHHACRPC